MELWIRSQDKRILVKVEAIGIENDEKSIYMENQNMFERLGSYNTKERALEVLNEIQKIFEFEYVNREYKEIDLLLKARMTPTVYEMPEE